LLNAGIGPPFIGLADKSDSAPPRGIPGYNNQAAMAPGEFLAPVNKEKPVARRRKTLALQVGG